MLTTLGFDLIIPTPVVPLDRYLRLLNLHQNKMIEDMALLLAKFALNDLRFATYRPSAIAACTLIIALNIFKRDEEEYEQKGAFRNGFGSQVVTNDQSFFSVSTRLDENKCSQLLLNLQFWKKFETAQVSGYTIDMLRPCLYDLCSYTSEYLKPDRLAGFDIKDLAVSKLVQIKPFSNKIDTYDFEALNFEVESDSKSMYNNIL